MTSYDQHELLKAKAKINSLEAGIEVSAAKICRHTASIQMAKIEIEEQRMIFERAQFEPITWDELEAELKENGHPGDYERNPVLANNYGSKTYCKINASGKLQVGPYERTDNFIPGCQLFISYPRRPWG